VPDNDAVPGRLDQALETNRAKFERLVDSAEAGSDLDPLGELQLW
jgi:hypothetical protein